MYIPSSLLFDIVLVSMRNKKMNSYLNDICQNSIMCHKILTTTNSLQMVPAMNNIYTHSSFYWILCMGSQSFVTSWRRKEERVRWFNEDNRKIVKGIFEHFLNAFVFESFVFFWSESNHWQAKLTALMWCCPSELEDFEASGHEGQFKGVLKGKIVEERYVIVIVFVAVYWSSSSAMFSRQRCTQQDPYPSAKSISCRRGSSKGRPAGTPPSAYFPCTST